MKDSGKISFICLHQKGSNLNIFIALKVCFCTLKCEQNANSFENYLANFNTTNNQICVSCNNLNFICVQVCHKVSDKEINN